MTEFRIGVVDVFVLDAAGELRVLLMRRAMGTRCTGAWEIVHGQIEADETPEAAAVREVREETGLEVQRLYNVICQPFYLHRIATVQLAVAFAAFVDVRSSLGLSSEHDAAEWMRIDEAAERVAWPRTRHALRDVEALLRGGDAGAVEDVLRVY
ncbi:MAG: NUDIX domain-containing protein [Gemmatimonadaceae bacterium]